MELFESLTESFHTLSDPRVLGRTKHKLIDVLVLSVLAIMSNAESFIDIVRFGKIKFDWLKKFLELPNGIPSHDTIARVFLLINPEEFEQAFMTWIDSLRAELQNNDTICFDGKTIKGTVKVNTGANKDCLHLINVWSTQLGLVLGQMKGHHGSGEKVPTLNLIDKISIEHTTVIADAGIACPDVAEKVVKRNANYIFPVKKNARIMYYRLENLFNELEKNPKSIKKIEVASSKEKHHGRAEERICTMIRAKELPKDFNDHKFRQEYFPKLKAIGRIEYYCQKPERRCFIREQIGTGGEHIIKHTKTTSPIMSTKTVRYYVTSLDCDAQEMLEKARLQWSIENKLHWVLDVGFNEDGGKVKAKNIAQNLAIIRKIAFNLVKQNNELKCGTKAKLKAAGWDELYLERILFQKNLK